VKGIVRGFPAFLKSGEKIYLSTALQALSCYRRERIEMPSEAPDPGRPWFLPPGKMLRMGDKPLYLITREGEDVLHLSYYRRVKGSRSQMYNFEDVVQNRVPPDAFKGKVVILGNTDRLSHDIHQTPLGRVFGIYVQNVALRNLLEKEFLYPLHPRIVLALSMLMGVFILLAVPHLRPLSSFLLVLCLAACILGAGYYLFLHLLFLEISVPLFTLVISYVTVFLAYAWRVEKERGFIKETFAKYAPREVVDRIVEDCARLKPEGDRQEVTILFTDIVGFTPIAERQTPEETIGMLNEYFEKMTRVVFRHGGMIKQFVGDEIMVIFGAPVYRKDHATKALIAALEMRESALALKAERERDGKPGFDARFGLNSGIVVLGNIGSSERVEYGAVGDVVNTTSRIMGLNKNESLGITTMILAGERTLEIAGDSFEFRCLGSFSLKGKEEEKRVFEILGRKDGIQ
jgi:adenylate cyclase